MSTSISDVGHNLFDRLSTGYAGKALPRHHQIVLVKADSG